MYLDEIGNLVESVDLGGIGDACIINSNGAVLFSTQSLAFSCEPLDTFGSDAETESTTFTYSLGINPFFVKGLSFNGSAEYAIDKPLDKSSPTERTTTFNAGLSHSRALSRKLSRTLSYTYSWENSNFHHDGANIEHLVTYQLNYVF